MKPARSEIATSTRARSPKPIDDPYIVDLLGNIGEGKTVVKLGKNETAFAQGSVADAIYFIQTGRLKLTVASTTGSSAVLTTLGPQDFVGEGCLVGQALRMSTATAIVPSTLVRIDKGTMLQSLRTHPELSLQFTTSLLTRNMALEETLCAQLFNHAEKRLARILLKLVRLGAKDAVTPARMPRVSDTTLAKMVGTTRPRITRFMAKFRKLGLIDYDGGIVVRGELLTDVVLHD